MNKRNTCLRLFKPHILSTISQVVICWLTWRYVFLVLAYAPCITKKMWPTAPQSTSALKQLAGSKSGTILNNHRFGMIIDGMIIPCPFCSSASAASHSPAPLLWGADGQEQRQLSPAAPEPGFRRRKNDGAMESTGKPWITGMDIFVPKKFLV